MNPNDTFTFGVALKTLPTEGNLVYEYNPFYNYRLDHTMIYYKKRLWKLEDFAEECGVEYGIDEDTKEYYFKKNGKVISNWGDIIPKTETPPIVYQAGLLVDFETDLLNFSLNNPVNITPQYSYDNSVNLIINDGKNPPRLINSRFSATERNKYQVCNRKGNNDSNIYDLGVLFDIDTSLYKKMNTIPLLRFLGVNYGGNLSIGNYHFYFRYVDEDGNESDYFAESGLVSIFIGNSADSIHSGFRNQNSNKLIKFLLSNTDISYSKVSIYYTKTTSDIFEESTVLANKIMQNYKLSDNGNTIITISGFEKVLEVPLDEINALYQMYGSVETLATAQNMLFLGNVDKPKIPYEDLADCALRFLPELDTTEKYDTNLIGTDYSGSISNTYYDTNYIYNKVGYWDDEIYRLGIVFILSDNTLTEVFNVRGNELSSETTYTDFDFWKDETNKIREYISYNELYYNIISDKADDFENAKGVVRIKYPDFKTVIGFNFKVDEKVINHLKNDLNIKGFFFVRLKRIPTTLCQAYTIGIDKESHTPVLPTLDKDNNECFITESFLTQVDENAKKDIKPDSIINMLKLKNIDDKSKELSHDFSRRKYTLENQQVVSQGAICPEYDVNYPYLNSLFSASELVCRDCGNKLNLTNDNIHFYLTEPFEKTDGYTKIKVIGVEDNVKLVAINDNMFSARAGEAEEAFRFEYIGKKNVNKDATNLLRGSYGPFLGITGYEHAGHLIDIKIPGYNQFLMKEYFGIRYEDKSAFYAISDRYGFYNLEEWTEKTDSSYKLSKPIYRGDCYICLFTHRLNRNFQDPTSPMNDEIVDPDCWKDNFDATDGVVKKENFDKINLGDVNAVRLGMYVTLTVRSTMNLNVRALDTSIPDEEALFGHPRGFYPYFPMTTRGSYKTPEALCYNKGFEKSLSERYNFEVPDVPWIKNEFSNRIAYSNILIQDAFLNGWRTFIGTHYRDYPKTYGSITKLVELKGDLLCVFEHGVALIPINERAVAGEGSGGYVYINTSNVLPENPKVISDTFGSQWRESIVKTPTGVYGVDTIGKKVWRTDGVNFECISDFRILEFLNQNISLSERELEPIIGVRNVKSHYNKFKGDVMFTFYDNLHGFEEKVWNICYNENILKWITFYSWVPSYSENIYNQYFSFDRNTSKWIAKLGTSLTDNLFADGVTLKNNIIDGNRWNTLITLSNRTLPTGDNVTCKITYELVRDNYGNYKLFNLKNGILTFTGRYSDITSEFYERDKDGKIIKDDNGRRKWLSRENQKNPDKVVLLLNIRANITVTYNGADITLGEAYALGYTNGAEVDAGYYESVVAVIPKYNMLFLTTDFWKHGLAGIIDIADKVYPTYWYGKQHPFEFEFVVVDNPDKHKIFDNLEIISNKAAPESFHYEIVGECYDFANDKKNMYIRQEATKELYQYNGSDIMFNHDYKRLDSEHRPAVMGDPNPKYYDKSTIFPLYYSRRDTINEIEDYYHLYGHKPEGYSNSDCNFSALAGAEIVRYENLDEYRIWNHAKGVDIHDFYKGGRIRGNMLYKEDKWDVQINPINLVQKNESKEDWTRNDLSNPPIVYNLFPLPGDISNITLLTCPDSLEGFNVTNWNDLIAKNKEVKIKDKFIKVRIRYTGDNLAIISAIKTLYSISFA